MVSCGTPSSIAYRKRSSGKCNSALPNIYASSFSHCIPPVSPIKLNVRMSFLCQGKWIPSYRNECILKLFLRIPTLHWFFKIPQINFNQLTKNTHSIATRVLAETEGNFKLGRCEDNLQRKRLQSNGQIIRHPQGSCSALGLGAVVLLPYPCSKEWEKSFTRTPMETVI